MMADPNLKFWITLNGITFLDYQIFESNKGQTEWKVSRFEILNGIISPHLPDSKQRRTDKNVPQMPLEIMWKKNVPPNIGPAVRSGY